MRTLITGVNGFIGAHVAKHMIDEGNEVVGIGRSHPPSSKCPLGLLGIEEELQIYDCDLAWSDRFQEIVKYEEPDLILHFAAQAIVSRAFQGPEATFRNNVLSTLSVLQACKETGTPTLIFTTDKVYGSSQIVIDESSPYMVGEPYATSKVACDAMALSYRKTYNLPILVVRSCNVYGPYDLERSRIVPDTIMTCLKGESPILNRTRAKMVRTYIYVDDLVSALHHLVCIRSKYTDFGSISPINVGTPYAVTTEAVKYFITQEFGVKLVYDDSPVGSGEIQSQVIAWDKLARLGWTPSVVMLGYGLLKTIDWWKEYWKKYPH